MSKDYNKNNLHLSLSPFLQQSKDSKINWQEWDKDVIEYAKINNKLLFLSIGYSSYWYNMIEKEVFSYPEVYNFINENFISVKIDKDERPDIDEYFSTFSFVLLGFSGWPLYVVITPDIKPIYAFNYLSFESKIGKPGILDILKEIISYYNTNKNIEEFTFTTKISENIIEPFVIQNIGAHFDWEYYGIGNESKFIYPSTLLFLLYYYESLTVKDIFVKSMIINTLDKMIFSGLHDNLQGGFFRYTIDREWNLPVFEKMLYDQGFLLWIYSLAYHLFKEERYKDTALKIINCLFSEFKEDYLFCSSIIPDINDEENNYYLWSYSDLKSVLTENELQKLKKVYDFSKTGNYKENKNYLIKKNSPIKINKIEKKLLEIRKKRGLLNIDKRIITSWNAITGIGLIHAYRYIEERITEEFIKNFLKSIIDQMYLNGELYHISTNKKVKFLEDYLYLLLFLTYYYEEFHEKKELIFELYDKLKEFKKGEIWVQSINNDFLEIPIKSYDFPIPSQYSVLEMVELRIKILNKEKFEKGVFKKSLFHDFYNIATLIRNGNFNVIETVQKRNWKTLPINTIQVPSN